MLAEIITIGDEILIGQIVDTNSVFISKELNKIGVKVYQITSIQDEKQHIVNAFNEAMSRVDLVLITGGLGPTKDDITKQTFLDFFQDTLVENTDVLENVKLIFTKYLDKEPLPSNLEQAMVPSKATILDNPYGTAPGMWMEKENTVFVSMPGVPFEMKNLMTEQVLPRVIKKFNRPFIYHKTLLTYGKGETEIQEIISDWEEALPNHIKLAYLPSLGRVRLRLSSTSEDETKLKTEIDSQMDRLHAILSDIAIGYEGDTSLVQQISEALVSRKATLSIVESCTGGTIAQEITAIAGASSYFKGGLIPYDTSMKTTILGVEKELIEQYNVVSIEVASQMAIKSNILFDTQYAIATTGIAGPSKGDGDDEVGTVCIAVAGPRKVIVEKFNFGNARERVILKAKNKALEMLLKEILKN
ncbi:CinA family nicotinamide mononucleotide deamidase-related protein [Patiriisocius marinus]|uniref:CinA-like protein n=1 Tax=Patiriisocius marinus TaxID=1397112 RepID=A0A5J4J3C3_9FLAO|nr:CinA family nicotinamide mononucleotide deamidase-related protein [Patiriisocius marinus]GER58947.1 CinA-like protein [Patiriisocius marinus]